MSFGRNLNILRKRKGHTLRTLGQELNISFSALGKYERDEHEPNFETLVKLADYFDVSLDFLLGRTNKK